MTAAIKSFKGKNRFLSNFPPAKIVWKGITFPSVEHAYQAAKSTNAEYWAMVAALETPGEAKVAGKKVPKEDQRANWDTIKLTLMREFNEQKYKIPEYREQLLATGDAELIEGNTWGDKFWGVCGGEGENHLGKILMDIRAKIQGEINA